MLHLVILGAPLVIAVVVSVAVFGLAAGMICGTALVIFMLAYVAGSIRRLFDEFKPRKYRTIIHEYEAPHLLEPAELGYLLDYRTKQQEVLATLVMLLQKDVVNIRRGHKGEQYFFIQEEPKASLCDIETEVLSWLRTQSDHSLHEINKNVSRSIGLRDDFNNAVVQSLISKGYIHKPKRILFVPRSVFGYMLWLLAATAGIRIVFNTQPAAELNHHIIDVAIIRIVAVTLLVLVVPLCLQLIAFAYRKGAKRPYKLKARAVEHWADIVGFRLFLKTVEFPRLMAKVELQNETLPYCIALGMPITLKDLISDK